MKLCSWLPTIVLTTGIISTSGQDNPFIQVDGSGASNPSRCYWHILQEMETQTKVPTRLNFRATSSGPGQRDFVGNVTLPRSDYSSGDYPMTKERYDLLKENGIEMVHLPVLIGAISVFHSVPVKEGHSLNLTSCIMARIYKREITDWNHPDIVEINPNTAIPIKTDNYGNPSTDQSFPIIAARRLLGSSSTFAFTNYLHKTCPEEWGEELVGSKITWPEDTKICQGPPQMVTCVEEEEGTIGYIDAGLGHDAFLGEAALRMDNLGFKDGEFYLTAANSISKGGILPVLDEETAGIPDSSDADWSGVDLVNQVQGYVYTWPIVSMTYIYVRKDLPSFMPDPRAQSLLIAFLKNLYDETYNEICESRFQFIAISGHLRDMALEGISMLETSPGAPEWIVEKAEVLEEEGQGDYVISTRRKSALTIQQDIVVSDMEVAEARMNTLVAELEALRLELAELKEEGSPGGTDTDSQEFGNEEEKHLRVAFVLSILSICLWVTMAVCILMQRTQIKMLAEESVAVRSATVGHNHKHATRRPSE